MGDAGFPPSPRQPRPRWFWLALGAIVVAAFVVRLVYVLTIGRRNPTGGDPLYYHVQANLLAKGHGFAEPFTWLKDHRIVPTAIHPPLFTLALAVSSVLGGTSFFAHKVVSCLLGSATVGVVGLIATAVASTTRAGPGSGRPAGISPERLGLVAAGLAAVYPNLWVVDGILMPETLFGLTIALVVLAAYGFLRRPALATAALTGAAIGFAALVRGEAVFLLLLLAPALALLGGGRFGTYTTRFAAMVLAAIVVVAPWSIRNLDTFKAPVPISANSEEVLANANCDLTWHGPLLGFWALSCYGRLPPGDESQRAAAYRRQGLDYIRRHEYRLPVVLAARVGRVWDLYRPLQSTHLSTIEGRDLRLTRAGLANYAVLVPFAIAGYVLLRRRRRYTLPLLAQALLVTATAIYAYGAIRFRMPGEVAIVVLAAVAVDALGVRAAAALRRSARVPRPVAAIN